MKTIPMKAGMAAALAASSLIVTPALAEEKPLSVAVQYSDLNLATAQGQAVLEQRLDRAARQVCRVDEVRVGTRIRSRDAQLCYNETKRDLEQQIAAAVKEERAES